jgi:hypothetical protein
MTQRLLGVASLFWSCISVISVMACDAPRGQVARGGEAPRQRASANREAFHLLVDQVITSLDLERAERMLDAHSGLEVSLARARIAIYRGDCEGASARLSQLPAKANKSARELSEFSDRCANATVGGFVTEDKERGIWIRIQDRADEVLVPLLVQTAAVARDAIEKDLGTVLPRPLRLDLVRDLFSLSAVSGLPLESAETTGTVAVARFGRVTMLSPRATRAGYPWQDTLAHEITHLILSVASGERAPLWLQEGVAKREETRWRERRAFDDPDYAQRVAKGAQASGKSVGIDKLGPSIAMLPSADAATIAFAEVTSFVRYLLARCGPRVLPALLAEMRSLKSPERALVGITGLGLEEWQIVWRSELESQSDSPDPNAQGPVESPALIRRAVRLSELLFLGAKYEAAAERAEIELDRAPRSALLRFQAARALGHFEAERVPEVLGDVGAVSGPVAGHLALLGGEPAAPRGLVDQALALDPFLMEVACGALGADDGSGKAAREALCGHVRGLPRRGSE